MVMPNVNDFVFAPRYRILRHTLFWSSWLLGWACFWSLVAKPFAEILTRIALYIPVFMMYSYPISKIAVPKMLLKGNYMSFVSFIILWLAVGWYLNLYFLKYFFLPGLGILGLPNTNENIALGFHCLVTTAASFSAISLLKHWMEKQQAWLQAEQEKIIAQLQLLKAQLHPHFLFNTLNNIYSFALHYSPKTPEMVLRLSSLLSYMLYDCKGEEVLLEKELDVMKNYIDLERERYGDKIDISINIIGDIEGKYICPLLMLPFLENAFKHGTSEQLGRPWLSVDLSVKDYLMKCKVVNSKNELVPHHENGVGINNVKKRLQLLYPDRYDLKLSDEGDFFVVSLILELRAANPDAITTKFSTRQTEISINEKALPVN